MSSDAITPSTTAEVLAAGTHQRRRYVLSLVGLFALLILAATVGMSIGAVSVPFGQVWSIIWRHISQASTAPTDAGIDIIIWQIRAPRVVLGALIGAGLAIIGVAVQAMVRNPLADPYVLGVESGAAAGAVAVIFFGGALGKGIISPAIGAFVGAILTLILVFTLARQGGRVSSLRLLLVGVALSFALSGITTFMQYATHDPAAQQAILFWLIGGLGGAQWAQIPLLAGVLAIAAVACWYYARPLNALAVGDEAAMSFGLKPDQLRTRLFVILSLVIAVAVSIVGPIGFIGLVVPHVARLLVGAEHRRVLPVALLLGGIYLVAVDVVSRWIFAPSEIPVGVLTAILGTPFFIWLIRRREAMAIRDAR